MECWGCGFATGIGAGFAIGLIVGRLGVKGQSWSELSRTQKRIRIGLITIASLLVVAGIVLLVTR